MKVLFHLHSLGGGGAERVVSILSRYWATLGHEVTVVTLAGLESDFYRVDERVRRISLNLGHQTPGLLPKLTDNIRRLWRLRTVLRQVQPQLAIAMMDSVNVSLAIAGIGLRDIVRVGSERVYSPSASLSFPWRLLRRLTYGLLHGVVVLSKENEVWLRRHTTVRRTWVIPNPVELPLSASEPVRSPEEWRVRPRRVIAVGRYARQKGLDLLVDAFARILPVVPDWELVIVGEGPERKNLQEQLTQRGCAGRVFLSGAVGNIADWYAAADLFVLSSRWEGFPNSLLEALAHGLPVVAADCLTGPRSLVREGIDGVLVPPNDAASLAAAMERLMTDDEMRRKFARRASEVRNRYSVEKVAGLWMTVMENEGS
jgi:glycosyltransferase involved in cell wall biosynthesis